MDKLKQNAELPFKNKEEKLQRLWEADRRGEAGNGIPRIS